jgi:hypothetical protein
VPGTQGAEAELIGEPGLPDAVAGQLLQELLKRAELAGHLASAEPYEPLDPMGSGAGLTVMDYSLPASH